MLNPAFQYTVNNNTTIRKKEEEEKKEQRMDLYDDIRVWSPIQFLTRPTRLNLSAVTKPSFTRVIARDVFLVMGYLENIYITPPPF